MAGIEKVCEFSGVYASGDMYRYKRNHIQVIPEHRKKFRGAEHVLHIFKPEKKLVGKGGRYVFIWDDEETDYLNFIPPYNSKKEWMNDLGYRYNLKHHFMLQVFDDELSGDVGGCYVETTRDLTGLKRRLKRMLRCKTLNIVEHDCDIYEWYEKENEHD